MTHHLTPYRRRSAPAHPGFGPREIDVDMDICRWCGGLVPAAETQRVMHEDWEQRIANRFTQLLDRVAILEAATAQLSGSAQAPPAAPADPDPNVPTPEQEATAGRSGAGAATNVPDQAGAGSPPADAATPPGGSTVPPGRASGGTKRPRPAGDAATTGRADPDQAEQAAFEQQHASGPGRFR